MCGGRRGANFLAARGRLLVFRRAGCQQQLVADDQAGLRQVEAVEIGIGGDTDHFVTQIEGLGGEPFVLSAEEEGDRALTGALDDPRCDRARPGRVALGGARPGRGAHNVDGVGGGFLERVVKLRRRDQVAAAMGDPVDAADVELVGVHQA